ncbi:SCO family protein [Acidihalobacter aeolianus]|uniref:SCO family protein n=1 Tax=Acidihalobacter aeolianus TaxID=2792603 RepID=UPI0012EAAB19|nr:SCO family protein [Acidihalobacter aeolianus]
MSEWVSEKPAETTQAGFIGRAHLLGLAAGTLVGIAVMLGLSLLLSFGPKAPPAHPQPITALARNVPDVIFKAPSFTGFVNQNGQKISSGDFNGKVQVVSFLFPLCTSMCPVIASHIVNLEQQVKQAGLADRVRMVSFNVAAGKTSPAEMADFMREYGGDPKSSMWQFLTSSPQAMSRVVRHGYHEYFQMISLEAENKIFAQQQKAGTYNYLPNMQNKLADKVNPDFDITHSSSIILVGPHGNVRYVMNDADTVPIPVLLQKVKSLLKLGRS